MEAKLEAAAMIQDETWEVWELEERIQIFWKYDNMYLIHFFDNKI